MAVCIRCNDIVALDLHPSIWCQLAGEAVDCREIDPGFFRALDFLDSGSAEDVADMGLTFTIPVGSGEMCLKNKGNLIAVTVENRAEYTALARAAKACEGRQQIDTIREGMLEVIPLAALAVLNAAELEEHVCGQRNINVATLQQHASYGRRLVRSNVTDNFWAALEGFSQQDLQAFMRFVTGRPRVPVGKDAVISIDCIDEPVDGLPEAHTCSSLICLPPYTRYAHHSIRLSHYIPQLKNPLFFSSEHMRRQLLYAVRNCDTTDIV